MTLGRWSFYNVRLSILQPTVTSSAVRYAYSTQRPYKASIYQSKCESYAPVVGVFLDSRTKHFHENGNLFIQVAELDETATKAVKSEVPLAYTTRLYCTDVAAGSGSTLWSLPTAGKMRE